MSPVDKREAKRQWRLNNPEKVLAQKKRYRERHKDQIRASEKAYYHANKDKRLALARKWALANPEKVRSAARKHSRMSYPKNRKKFISVVLRSRARRIANESVQEKEARLSADRRRYKAWSSNNPEAIKTHAAKYRETHRAEKRAAWKKYYDANKAKRTVSQNDYRKRKRHVYLNQKHRRRSRELEAFVEDCTDTIQKLMASTQCHWCHKDFAGNKVTIDHVIPLSRGGKHRRDNLVAACQSCNSSKSDKLPNEWLQEAA